MRPLPTRRHFLATGTALAAAPLLPVRAAAAETCDVAIIGAGIAGLYAARLLQGQGAKVLVLEATARAGGRMKTLSHLPGAPEAGGQTLDAMYARVLAEVETLGLSTFPRKPPVPGDAFFINGSLGGPDHWAASPGNHLPGPLKSVAPGRLLNHLIDLVNPVPALADWKDGAYRGLDALALAERLAAAGANAEALRLMGLWVDGQGLAGQSALFAYRKRLVEKFGAAGAFRIKGGSSALTRRMAESLGASLRHNAAVRRIDQDQTGVTLGLARGGRVRAGHVLCAAPLPALRDIAFTPAPTGALADAITRLPYSAILMVTLAVQRPFWEQDGLPPAMFLDSAAQRITAPGGQDGGVPTLSVWVRGDQRRRLLALGRQGAGAAVVAALESARPSARGAVKVADITDWPFAYHSFAPGQIAALFDGLRQPLGRVRFIGEHMSDLQQGMEGACEAAEREALALLAA